MSVIKQLNSAPYFDDYSPEDKDFLRILFRPGYAVQARELNQMQSILQTQVERFGNHIFKDGSIVVGGQTTIDCQTPRYITIADTYNSAAVNVNEFLGKVIVGSTNSAQGLVVAVDDGTDATVPKTLIYKPLNGYSFTTSDTLSVESVSMATVRSSSFTAEDSATYSSMGPSSTVSIDSGIFFTQGIFVINSAQTTWLDKYTNSPNKLAGLDSSVNIIDDIDDDTLLDNANGSYNYAAPGAHRLKIDLTLQSQEVGYTSDTFIQLLEAREGQLYKQISRPSYSEIMKTLARRTFDQSGDYTVKPFILNLESDQTDSTNLVARISKGNAYVKGYEVETIATQELDVPKARTTASENNKGVSITYGNYVQVAIVAGLPDINNGNTGPSSAPGMNFYLYNVSSVKIGSAKVRDIDFVTSATFNFYLFDVVMDTGYAFTNVTKISNHTSTYNSGTCYGTIASAVLTEPEQTPLVYNLGYGAVSSLADYNFSYSYYQSISTVSGSGPYTITLSTLSVGSGTYSSSASDYYVINNAGTKIVPSSNPTPTNGGRDVILSFSASFTSCKVVAKIFNGNPTINSKTRVSVRAAEGYFAASSTNSHSVTLKNTANGTDVDFYKNGKLVVTSGPNKSLTTFYDIVGYNQTTKTVTLDGTGPTITVGVTDYYKICPAFTAGTADLATGVQYSATTTGAISLGKADGIKIVKILSNVSSPTMNDWFDESKNVTNKFVFDNGQRDNYYDLASVSLIAGQTVPGPVAIFFEYYSHTINGGMFVANSYPAADASNPQIYIDSNKNKINLLTAIDCRPTKTNSTTFSSPVIIPKVNSTYSADVTYYLPRIDKIAVTVDGTFTNIQGIPSLTPKVPKDIDNGMTLYQMYIPAYTYTPDSVIMKFIENKRYTMRDIGKLEKRIENVEYYTSLSALEQNTTLFNVKDTAGTDRFKNGILVDSFSGHNIGDVSNADYHCSMDIQAQELRPEFRQKGYKLTPVSFTGATGVGNLITASYGATSFVTQTVASRSVNVNPFSVFNWIGKVTLSPNNDFWKDTKLVPRNVNNPDGALDNVTAGKNPFGTLFNQWNSMWFGTETVTTGFEEVSIPEQTWSGTNVEFVPAGNQIPAGTANSTDITSIADTGQNSSGTVTIPEDSSAQPGVWILTPFTQVIPATTSQRPITETVTVPTPPPIKLTTLQSGNIVADVSMSEYIRPKTIVFSAVGMKPNTTVYPFFDGKDVSSYVTFNSTTTDNNGNISGSFAIPAGQFFVGDRIFLLTDSSTGNRAQESTSAESKYVAQGLEEQTTTLDIPVSLPDPNSPFWRNAPTPPRPVDPLAQTFFVDPVIYPEGIFIPKVDLYFKTKDSSVGLTVQIRETLNGYPSSTNVIVDTVVPSASINTSDDASLATTVTFPNVVYLSPGEYAIVLMSNSNNYEAWVAQIGEAQVGGNQDIISSQPYVGSLFKSQNASTWTAEQTQDLTFNLYKCKFTTGNFTVECSDWDETDAENIVTLSTVRETSATNSITGATGVGGVNGIIKVPYNPYATGSVVTYTGSVNIGLGTSGTYYVERINADYLKLYSDSGRTTYVGATGTFSGTHTLSGTGAKVLYLDSLLTNNVVYGSKVTGTVGINNSNTTVTGGSIFDNTIVMSNDITATVPAGTAITFKRKPEGTAISNVIMVPNAVFNPFSSCSVTQSVKGATGPGSFDVNTVSWVDVPVNKNYQYTSIHNVEPAMESFRKKIYFSTSSEHVSPVINATRQSVVQVENIINNDYTNETQSSGSGGNAWARYITRKVTLADNSSYMKVYLTANKPYGTTVKVYYKVRSSEDSSTLDSRSWTEMTQDSPDASKVTTDPNEFLEYVYVPDSTQVENSPLAIKYTNGATYHNFIEYAIKIVMLSDDTCNIPRVADLRTIVTI
jgi:hypothetical protein